MEIHVVVECQLASEVYGQVPKEASFFFRYLSADLCSLHSTVDVNVI